MHTARQHTRPSRSPLCVYLRPFAPYCPITDANHIISKLSFRSLVRDVDRRQAIRDQAAGRTSEAEGLHRRKAEGGEFNAMTMAAPAAVTDADGLEIPNLPLVSDSFSAKREEGKTC